MSANLSPKNEVEKRLKRSTEWWTVFKKHLALFSEHYRQPISELSTMVYAEDLAGLSWQDLDAACVHARQNSEFMPTSATILKAHAELSSSRAPAEYLGPPLIEYAAVSAEEREAALAFSEELKKKLAAIPPAEQIPKKKTLTFVPSRLSLEEQKTELRRRGLLK